jgi:outer membrane protein
MRLFTLLALIVLVMTPLKAKAELNIAVIDIRFVLTQSEAGKSVNEQRNTIQAEFLEEISKTEQALRAEEQALLKERESLGSEEFLKKKQVHERKLLETGRSTREKKQVLEGMFSDAMNSLQKELMDIVKTIADEKKYDIVLTKQNVVISTDALDITKDALESLNKSMPSVELKKP